MYYLTHYTKLTTKELLPMALIHDDVLVYFCVQAILQDCDPIFLDINHAYHTRFNFSVVLAHSKCKQTSNFCRDKQVYPTGYCNYPRYFYIRCIGSPSIKLEEIYSSTHCKHND